VPFYQAGNRYTAARRYFPEAAGRRSGSPGNAAYQEAAYQYAGTSCGGDRRPTAEGSKSRLSKKHIDPKDNDARGKINLARLSGKDRTGEDLYKRMENRLDRLDEDLKNTVVPVRRKCGVTLETTLAKKDRLCAIPAGSLPPDESRSLGGRYMIPA
jgi:hypothetical protein